MKLFRDEKLDEEYYYGKTDLGLSVCYVPKKGFDRQYAILSTNFGSVINKFRPIGEEDIIKIPDGVAHFLEHKLFEEEDASIDEKFAKLGASVNAFTGFDQTSYLFSTTSNFYEGLKTLIEFVQNPHFTDENVNKEKGIIEQEIKMYEDDPNWRVFFNCLDAMYHEHPIKIDIAGTVESIQDIDKDILYKTYDTFYHPENMVLFIVGDLDVNKIIEVIDESERKDYDKLKSLDIVEVEEPKTVRKHIVIDNMATSNPLFFIGFKDNNCNLTGKAQVEKELITNILLDMIIGESSYFYNKLYDDGLIDTNFGSYYTGKDGYGHSLIMGESDNPKKVFDLIMEFIKKPIDKILIEEDFHRIKNDEIGSFIMSFDSVDYIGNLGTEFFLTEFSLFEYLNVLENITFKQVKERFIEHLQEDNVVLSIVNPLSND